MYQQVKNITDEQIKHLTPTNISVTPVNIILPKKLPMRDDNVWLTSPVKVSK